MAATSGGGNAAGIALLQDLLRRPPAEVASWAVDQASALSSTGTDLERSPIFQVAGALSAVPVEQKQALIHSALAGVAELPATKKAQAVRLVMQTKNMAYHAENQAVQQQMSSDHKAALSQLASLTGAPAPSDAAPRQPTEALTNAPPLVQNVMRLVQEARFDQMSQQEQKVLAQEARSSAMQLAQPEQLLEVVQELKPEEREQLTDALVDAKVVPPEQREVVEQAIRPGGYADQVSTTLQYVEMVREHSMYIVIVPFVELVLSMIVGFMTCGSGLTTWLRTDAINGLATLAACYIGVQKLSPVYEGIRADPMGALQRWQISGAEGRSTRERIQMLVPGVAPETYQVGVICLVIALIFVLFGLIGAVVGVFELLASMVVGCSSFVVMVCIVFIGIRCAGLLGVMRLAMFLRDEVEKLRSQSVPAGGSSQIPMVP
eukprot:TRINITY_DN81207_c0_g1_i1.p1 TRINITY_DN81207_c0_g1~~TRINITY_DN81207_c0_g1_i1.p1  ORF type:complete len:445 (-),score=85.88 TRINITY_DN81207_c0_g1_i1:31-1332(-)